MVKQKRRNVLKGLGAAGIVSLAGCTNDSGIETDEEGNDIVDFTLSWIPKGQMSPAFTALERGFWSERDLSVEISRGYGSSDTVQEVGTGNTDIGFAGVTALASMVAEGMDVVQVGSLQPVPLASIYAMPDTGIEEPEDIVGHTGAYQTDINWVIGQAVFNQRNIDYENEVDWISTESGLDQMIGGNADFALDWGVNAGNLWYGEDSLEPNIVPFRDYTNVPGNGLVVRRDVLEDSRDVIRRFLEGLYEGFLYTFENGDDGVTEAVDYLFQNFEEMAAGEGSEDFHLSNLRLFLSNMLSDSVRTHGLGYVTEDSAQTAVETVNNYLLEDDSVDQSDLFLLDDRLVESEEFMVSNFDQQLEGLSTIDPGGFDNPLF